MKLDGHATITNKAIVKFNTRIKSNKNQIVSKKVSQLPIFNTWDIKLQPDSNSLDNTLISAFILSQEWSLFREGLQPLKKGFLTRETVAVDLELFKLPAHKYDYGQKYHYLRRKDPSKSVKDAHKECNDFIYNQSVLWIRLTMSLI